MGNAQDALGRAEPAVAPEPGYRRYVLGVLLLVYAFNFIDRQIVSVLAIPIKRDLGLSDAQLGMTGGLAFALLYSLLGIPVARLADRANRIGIISTALALWSLMTALCGLATGFGQLFLARLGVGIGEAGGVAPAYSLLCDYFPPRERARAVSIYSFGSPIGSAIGILAGGWVATHLSWRTAFIVVGLAGLFLTPLVSRTVDEPAREAGFAPAPGLRPVLSLLSRKASFWWLAAGAASASMSGYALFFWMPSLLVRSYGLSLSQASMGFGSMLLVAGVAGLWAGGVLADHYGHARRSAYALVPMAAFVLTVPFYAVGLTSSGVLTCLLVLAVPTALGLMWLGPVMAAVQHLVPPTMRATASAVFLLIVNLVGLGLGTTLIGWLSDALHVRAGVDSLRWAILAGSAFYLVGAASLALAARRLAADWES